MTAPCPPFSKLILSTALGTGGSGIFPYTLLPAYRRLLRAARATHTTVIAKSATRHPRRGNFVLANPLTWKYIRRLPHLGMLNAYGLTNPGAEVCARAIAAAGQAGFRVIPNLYPEFAKGTELAIQETLEAIAIFDRVLGTSLQALELNFSCPNSAEAITANVADSLACTRAVRRHFPTLCLIAKLSICHPYEFAQELENLGIGALHGVNTVPYDILFPGFPSPLAQVGGGGVSGGPAWQAACAYNAGLRRHVRGCLIMGCGVTTPAAVQRYLDLGADAVSLCTLALRRPATTARLLYTFNTGPSSS